MLARHSFIQTLMQIAAVLVLPLALLLFAQWPLREWLQAGSRQANDAAQILFAVYVAVAITAASRSNTHLAANSLANRPQHGARLWRYTLLLLCVGPWASFMLWAASPLMADSVLGLERFAETLTPGYFFIKLALGLLLVLILMDTVVAWWNAVRRNS